MEEAASPGRLVEIKSRTTRIVNVALSISVLANGMMERSYTREKSSVNDDELTLSTLTSCLRNAAAISACSSANLKQRFRWSSQVCSRSKSNKRSALSMYMEAVVKAADVAALRAAVHTVEDVSVIQV